MLVTKCALRGVGPQRQLGPLHPVGYFGQIGLLSTAPDSFAFFGSGKRLDDGQQIIRILGRNRRRGMQVASNKHRGVVPTQAGHLSHEPRLALPFQYGIAAGAAMF